MRRAFVIAIALLGAALTGCTPENASTTPSGPPMATLTAGPTPAFANAEQQAMGDMVYAAGYVFIPNTPPIYENRSQAWTIDVFVPECSAIVKLVANSTAETEKPTSFSVASINAQPWSKLVETGVVEAKVNTADMPALVLRDGTGQKMYGKLQCAE